jgi:small conductance mechanosensitive channel
MRNDLNKMITARRRSGAAESDISEEMVRLQYAEARVKGVAKSLETTAGLLASRGYQTAHYRQFIIQSTGEISEKILDPRVMFGILKDVLEDLGHWLKDNGPTILFRIAIVVLMVILFRLVFRLIWWLLRLTHLIKLTRLMVQLGDSIISPVASTIGLFAGLWVIGANPTTLLTGAGVAGVIIGFALQDSMANLAAGFFILATRPFDVDDVIRTGTVVGTVRAMWIANTTVVTFDGRRLLIPNRKIWADIIENRSAEPLRRADMVVRVGFEEDIDRVIAILHELVKEEGRVLDHPEPSIFTLAWAESWVEIAVRPWTRNADWWPLLMDLPRLVVKRFAAEGIEIPYPRRELAGPAGPRASGPGPETEKDQIPGSPG